MIHNDEMLVLTHRLDGNLEYVKGLFFIRMTNDVREATNYWWFPIIRKITKAIVKSKNLGLVEFEKVISMRGQISALF